MAVSQIPYSIASNAKSYLEGIVAERSQYYKNQTKQARVINGYIETIHEDFREAYDAYIPNVHVVDTDVFTKVIAERIVKQASQYDPNSQVVQRFSDPSSSEVEGLRTRIIGAVSSYHKKLLARQNGVTDPIQHLNNLAESLFAQTKDIDKAVVARNIGIKFSRLIDQVFGLNKSILASESPALGSSSTVFVFFSRSFASIGPAIRTNVYKSIEQYLLPTLQEIQAADLKLGNIVNLGHAALVSDIGAFTNSPAFANIMYGVGTGRSLRMPKADVRKAAEVFKIESGLLENSLQVSKELFSPSQGYGVLLSLGVTFTNVEDAEVNQARGRTTEAAAVRAFRIQKPVRLTPAAQERQVKSLLKQVLKDNPSLGKSSRNILEYIQDVIVGTISGKPTFGEKTLHTYTNKAVVSKPKQATFAKAVFKPPSISGNRTIPALRNIKGQFYSLAALQNLINARLTEVLTKNMGDGTRPDILNYRTGRFANSAKVERMSQSREGMITAFYTYMRNPYGTFSEGGAQGIPKSRDPKLLISKSIREIAATQVANRMRAVLA